MTIKRGEALIIHEFLSFDILTIITKLKIKPAP
jgi:hypothetical protein